MCREYDDDTDHDYKSVICDNCGKDFCEGCSEDMECPECGDLFCLLPWHLVDR